MIGKGTAGDSWVKSFRDGVHVGRSFLTHLMPVVDEERANGAGEYPSPDQARVDRLFVTVAVSASTVSACVYFLSSSEVRGYVGFLIEAAVKVLRLSG